MVLRLGQWLQLLAAALAIALGVVILRVARRHGSARPLAALLFIEATAQLLWCVQRTAQYDHPPWSPLATIAAMLAFSLQTLAYLALIRLLPSPFVAWLRRPGAMLVAAALIVGPVVANAILYITTGDTGDIANEAFRRGDYFGFAAAQLAVFGVGLYSLAVAVSAYRRAAPGSPSRRQARAFAIAFAVRDLLFAVALTLTFLLSVRAPERLHEVDPLWPLATILYVPLLAYGILQTQLFDIDLKLKVGISRSTVVTIGVVAVLGAVKTMEYSFNREYGAIAAGIVAGIVLVLAPRLNKLGDKVANTALPKVQPTSEYVSFKKLEVYKAAVESAIEDDGIIDAKERALLDRLRTKLGLAPRDADAIEAELASRDTTPSA